MKLPLEILLNIITLLDIPDILRFRMTCRTLSKASYERIIWISRLKEQSAYLPLSSELSEALHHEDQYLHAYTTPFLEKTVTQAYRTAKLWLEPRSGTTQKLKDTIRGTLMGLRMFQDRWLVAPYYEGMVFVYDVSDGSLYASLTGTGRSWSSFGVSMSSSESMLTIALARTHPPYLTEIYQLKCSPTRTTQSYTGFYLLQSFPLSFDTTLQTIKPADKSLVISKPGVVEIIYWDKQFHVDLEKKSITLQLEDLEGLWNGIIAVTFIGPYVLVFKTRSLEIHGKDSSTALLKHAFSMSFRVVSFSDSITSPDSSTGLVKHEMTLFAYDVIQGLFHYTVRLTVLPSDGSSRDMPLSLDVRLTGIYPLALGVVHPHPQGSGTPSAIESSSVPMTFSANFSPSPTFTPSHASPGGMSSSSVYSREDNNSTPTPISASSDYSSRGFLSAHVLGPQGKRGIWVERKRSSIVREVHVWARQPPTNRAPNVSLSSSLPADPSSTAVEIDRNVVYTSKSYDLRDDITCCAFGELSGTIVLGHRSGELSIIRLDDRNTT
ncbi:hypothetical protein CPC08DRAFT_819146 [Agrocybe pediades]|nr:hypothetical protein CPC08DRAFT_819146 [Agrocybe pediades]